MASGELPVAVRAVLSGKIRIAPMGSLLRHTLAGHSRHLLSPQALCALVIAALCGVGAGPPAGTDHIEHLRMMLAAASTHGTVIPQPEAITPNAAVTINITARSFSFTPSQFTVNQGDVV